MSFMYNLFMNISYYKYLTNLFLNIYRVHVYLYCKTMNYLYLRIISYNSVDSIYTTHAYVIDLFLYYIIIDILFIEYNVCLSDT